jgi:hypothetical protein
MTPEETRDELCKPFDLSELKFFPAARSGDKKKGKVATYADARVYMERLDKVVPGGWTTSYRALDPITLAVECTLSIKYGDAWVSRADVGYPNEAKDADNAEKEAYKAAYSDALKRAAVQHGIGRFIYSLELEQDWLPIDEWGKFTQSPRIKNMRPPSTPARPAQTPTQPRQQPQQAPATQTPAAQQQPAPATAYDQLGRFRKGEGDVIDTKAFLDYVNDKALKLADLAIITGTDGDNKPAITAWLRQYPEKSLELLVDLVLDEKRAATAVGAGR